jgi:hypothetical protein
MNKIALEKKRQLMYVGVAGCTLVHRTHLHSKRGRRSNTLFCPKEAKEKQKKYGELFTNLRLDIGMLMFELYNQPFLVTLPIQSNPMRPIARP